MNTAVGSRSVQVEVSMVRKMSSSYRSCTWLSFAENDISTPNGDRPGEFRATELINSCPKNVESICSSKLCFEIQQVLKVGESILRMPLAEAFPALH